ncbi:universal stress protein [Salinigranum sp. GCM10025319]|uniref:universal stress protein n=1 Tax=Salinigranum sp. GCM10025319 TaxID=3252687 RepID=UPI00361760FA
MVSRVLVPMDDSEMAERALRHALETYQDAEVTVLHVVGEPSGMMGEATRLALADDIKAAANELASDVFARAESVAEEYGTEVETSVEVGHPGRAIVNRAGDFDMVVIGTHGGSLSDTLLVGDVARRVFRRSPAPVTVIR